MSRSGKVLRTFEFGTFLELLRKSSKSLRPAEKSQGAAEKNQEKIEANFTGFSRPFFGSQSVEIFCFTRKTKIQILTTSFRSLTRIHQRLLKSLGLYLTNIGGTNVPLHPQLHRL